MHTRCFKNINFHCITVSFISEVNRYGQKCLVKLYKKNFFHAEHGFKLNRKQTHCIRKYILRYIIYAAVSQVVGGRLMSFKNPDCSTHMLCSHLVPTQ